MFKLRKQIEGQIQEIVFFFSLLLAFTTFLSGVLYLACSQENLTYILGVFGAVVDHGLFSFLGYAFFYLSVMSLHMGYIMNFHIFSFRDFKREYPILLYSLIAHLIVLVLFANLLSVIQLSLEIPSSKLLTSGAGGFVGHLFSGALYSNIGIYGSLISLLALMGVTALLGGFFELPDVIVAIKAGSNITRFYTVKSLKTVNSSLINGIQFLAKSNEEVPAHAGAVHRSPNWISNSWSKANHLMTDHFHIYKKEELNYEKKEDSKKDDQKIEKKSVSAEKFVQPEITVIPAKSVQKVKIAAPVAAIKKDFKSFEKAAAIRLANEKLITAKALAAKLAEEKAAEVKLAQVKAINEKIAAAKMAAKTAEKFAAKAKAKVAAKIVAKPIAAKAKAKVAAKIVAKPIAAKVSAKKTPKLKTKKK